MTEISLEAATAAAQDLVRLFNNNPNTPPQSHAVWVKTELDQQKEFVRSICVSQHPHWGGKLAIPNEHLGVPVQAVDWPKGQR